MGIRRLWRGSTLVEMLIAIAVVAVLVGILYPTLSAARERGRQAVCLSNLRQIGQALKMYRNDYGRYPPFLSPNETLDPYIKDRRILFCPNHKDPTGDPIGTMMNSSYAYLFDGDRLRHGNKALRPWSVIVFCLEHSRWEGLDLNAPGIHRPRLYSGFYTVLREDGSAQILPASRVKMSVRPATVPGGNVKSGVIMREWPDG